jgi:hypothetical protein
LIGRDASGVIAPSQASGFIFDVDTGRLREVKVLEDERRLT